MALGLNVRDEVEEDFNETDATSVYCYLKIMLLCSLLTLAASGLALRFRSSMLCEAASVDLMLQEIVRGDSSVLAHIERNTRKPHMFTLIWILCNARVDCATRSLLNLT